MIVIDNFNQVLAQIESERGIQREIIVSAIEQALVSACRKKLGAFMKIEARLNSQTGEAEIFQKLEVVDDVEDDEIEISLEDALKIDPNAVLDGQVYVNQTPENFGRIAAQTAKQVIIQRIREAEKNVIFDEFQDKIGTIINGTVQRVEARNYLINLGRVEALLFFRDVIPSENFQTGESIRVYIEDVEKTNKGAVIHISRTHPGFLKCLFRNEIPEIQDGIIEVMSVSREPGMRAKVAVKTNNPSIGAVGTCVGHMGSRIQAIIRELGQEKIDVLEWDENPAVFIANALKPAKIAQVILTSLEDRTAVVVVENDQLSLAIGKNGINVRLSVKLTHWKLDIVSTVDFENRQEELVGNQQVSIIEKIRLEKEQQQSSLKIKDEEETPSQLLESLKKARAEAQADQEDETTVVSDLANLLGMSSQELIDESAKFGLEIVDENSILSVEDVEKIKENISS